MQWLENTNSFFLLRKPHKFLSFKKGSAHHAHMQGVNLEHYQKEIRKFF